MITTIIGQILGISYLILAISILTNKRNIATIIEKITRDNSRLWFAGFTTVIFGTILISFSNFENWISSLIVLIGIASLVKGIMMMWFPRKMQKYYSRFAQRKFSIFLFGVITLVLSIILLISSF